MKKIDCGYKADNILLRVSRVVGSSLDMEKVIGLVLKESKKALASDHASLFLIDENLAHLILAGAEGFNEDEMENIKLLGSWEVISDQLVKKKRTLIVNDIYRNPIFRKKRIPFSKEKLSINSFLAVPLIKDRKVIGVLIVSNKSRQGHTFTRQDERLLGTLSNNIAAALLNAKLYRRLKSLFVSTVKSLAQAIDAKDRYTSGHSERVMKYSLAIGRELNLGEEDLENLGLSSLLHDVGKIGIREDVLIKPGKLSAFERKQINLHPSIGVDIVKTIDDSGRILRGIMEHHERFNGRGYPNHLKGRAISLDGRVIAIADTFDALTTDRPYHKKYSREKAFHMLNAMNGEFDPIVLKAFISSFKKHPTVWAT